MILSENEFSAVPVPPTYLLKAKAEDFQVEEELGFDLSGEGEHLCIYVEKTGLNTDYVAKILARTGGSGLRDVGYCGKKDRHAVTRQWFSLYLPKNTQEQKVNFTAVLKKYLLENLVIDPAQEMLTLLSIDQHHKKLKRGIHASNGFKLLVKEITAKPEVIEQNLKSVIEKGFDNLYGAQRFGKLFELSPKDRLNHLIESIEGSIAKLRKKPIRGRGRKKPLSAGLAWNFSQLRSLLFNQCIYERKSTYGTAWQLAYPGDILMLNGSQSCFLWEGEDEASIQNRILSGDLFITGPLFGRVGAKGLASKFEVNMYEHKVLDLLAPTAQDFLFEFQVAHRRTLIVRPRNLTYELQETENLAKLENNEVDKSDLALSFSLPSGSYATSMIACILG